MISALDCRSFVLNLSLRHVDPTGGRVFRNTKPWWPCLEFLVVITKKKKGVHMIETKSVAVRFDLTFSCVEECAL